MKKIMMLFALFTGFLVSAQNSMGKQDCSGVTSGKRSDGTPFYEAKSEDITFRTYFEADGIYHALSVNIPTYHEGSRILAFLLSNNVFIERKDIKLKPIDNGAGGKASFALIVLRPNEIELFKKNEIVKVFLAGTERVIKNGTILKNHFNCLLSKEPLAMPATRCNQIVTEKNESKREMNYQTPLVDGIRLKKVSQGGIDLYLGSVTVPSKRKLSGKGVMILFHDNRSIFDDYAEVLENPLKDGTYEYTALFIIKNEDMKLFSTHLIKGVTVIDAVALVNKKDEIQELATCLINK